MLSAVLLAFAIAAQPVVSFCGDGILTPVDSVIGETNIISSARPLRKDVTENCLDTEEAAKRLYYMGFINSGSDENGDPNFALERSLTKIEAAVMAVRLLGLEEKALELQAEHPYTDVPGWGSAYIGYLYSVGLLENINAVYFEPDASATSVGFLKYILFALGYDASAGDYPSAMADQLAYSLGLCGELGDTLTRGEAFHIMFHALKSKKNGESTTLAEELVRREIISYNDAVFLIWSEDEEESRRYIEAMGYSLPKALPDGYYSILLCDDPDMSLNVLADGANTDYEGVGVSVWQNSGDVSQKFRLERTERGTYLIYAACSRGGYNRVIGMNPYTDTAALYKATSYYAREFYILSADDEDGMYIIPADDTSLCLSAELSTYGGELSLRKIEGGSKNRWSFTQLGAVTEDGDEYAIWPSEVLYITQGAYDDYSHQVQNAVDMITMNGRAYAPFTGVIVRIEASYSACNAVWLESTSRVVWADGTMDYMTVIFMHDNYVWDLSVGQVVRQGEFFYDMGTAGYASAAHIHIAVLRGKYSPYTPFTGSGDVYAQDAFVLPSGTVVRDDYGLEWKRLTSD